MTHKLKQDHFSAVNKKLIAPKGQEVKVIGDHVNVVVVETIKGERFSCQLTLLDRIKL